MVAATERNSGGSSRLVERVNWRREGEEHNNGEKNPIRQLISLNKSINILRVRAEAVWN